MRQGSPLVGGRRGALWRGGMRARGGSRWNNAWRQAPERTQHSPIHQSQDVEHGGHVGVAVARAPLQVLQGLAAQRHSHLVAALARVLDHQVVQGPEAGWDLVATLLGRRGPRCLRTWGCVRGTESLQASCSPQPTHQGTHVPPKATAASLAPGTAGPCADSQDGNPRHLTGL